MDEEQLKVGMSETDNRRHYYHQQVIPMGSYFIRYCDWIAVDAPVVLMPDITADCKRCLVKNHEEASH